MPENPLTFTENKDGTISVTGEDGKETRFAKESDLLTVKGSLEAAERRLTTAKDSQEAELGTARTDLESTRQQLLQAEAKVESLEEEVKKGAAPVEELASVKQKLVAAEESRDELSNRALEFRRAVITHTYNIPADTIKDKTMEQLDSFEEALKAVVSARGIGNYAAGGVGGGATLSSSARDKIKAGFDELHPAK